MFTSINLQRQARISSPPKNIKALTLCYKLYFIIIVLQWRYAKSHLGIIPQIKASVVDVLTKISISLGKYVCHEKDCVRKDFHLFVGNEFFIKISTSTLYHLLTLSENVQLIFVRKNKDSLWDVEHKETKYAQCSEKKPSII